MNFDLQTAKLFWVGVVTSFLTLLTLASWRVGFEDGETEGNPRSLVWTFEGQPTLAEVEKYIPNLVSNIDPMSSSEGGTVRCISYSAFDEKSYYLVCEECYEKSADECFEKLKEHVIFFEHVINWDKVYRG